MADQKHVYEVTIDGETYEVESTHELSDADAYKAAASQHTPRELTQKEKNDRLMAANATPLKEPTTFGAGMAKGMRESTNPVVGPWMRGGPDTVVAGAKKLGEGRILGGAADLVKGVGTTVAPVALPFALAAAPAATLVGGVTGTLGSMGAEKAAELAGAGEDVQNAAGVAGGIVAGGLGAAGTKPAAGALGPTLVSRGERLGKLPRLERHFQAAAAGMIGGPKAAGAVEVIQSPAANRMAGTLLNKIAGQPTAPPALPLGRQAKVPKPPLSLDEQLGVSPNSTGAQLSSLPETPVPEVGRTPMALEFGAARRTEALNSARAAAQELGVASDVTSPNNPPPAVGLQDAPALPSPAARERIPVPQRLREPDPPPAPPLAKLRNPKQALIDVAREMGLDPDLMSSHGPLAGVVEDAAATTAHGARMAELSQPTKDLSLQAILGPDVDLRSIVQPGKTAESHLDPATQAALIEQLLKSSSFQGLVK